MLRISCGICKTESREAEHDLLKMENSSCKNVENVFKFEAGHEKSRIASISFIIFILKTTSIYFDLTCYYYTNLYVFLLWLNF